MSSVNPIAGRMNRLRRIPGPAMAASPAPGSADYLALIQKLLEMRQEQSNGILVGFTSVSRGQGVTYVIESLAWQLAQHTDDPILLCGHAHLAGAAGVTFWEPQKIQRLGKRQSRSAVFTKPGWEDLQVLRGKFGFVLVDCPAADESPILRVLSTLVDGIGLVVAAGETRRDQIASVHHALQTSGANVLGLVLNKQTDPIPRLFSRFL